MSPEPQLLLKRVINVKAIVTPLWKDEVQQQLQTQINQIDSSCNSWTFQQKSGPPEIQSRVYNLRSSDTATNPDNIRGPINQRRAK